MGNLGGPDFFMENPTIVDNASRPFTPWLNDHDPKRCFCAWELWFLWGARTVTNLGKAKLVQASVLLHPSYITVDDIRGVEIPIAILGAEHDSLSPPKLLNQFKQVLNAKPEIDSYVKIFANVSHGWTVRYDPNDPKAVKAAGKAHKIMINWFDKHLKK
ncbi:hydrolase pyvD-like [Vigna umbellata]|uniref:hydrolase pyvD-like n=1 Tax=Vigna umbellata TaxID=87088 RepID=UPI001F5F431F|nr:hydrolase pyvD-like [Vigna umbellata]